MLERLVKLGHLLDALGLEKEADFVDEVMQQIIDSGEMPDFPEGDDESVEMEPDDCGYVSIVGLDEPMSDKDSDWMSQISLDDLTDMLVETRGKDELEKLISSLKESLREE